MNGAGRLERLPRHHLPSQLTLADTFRFPVATKEARKDVLIGGCLIMFMLLVGSFAFVLGCLAAMAARDPLKHQIVIVAFIEFCFAT